MASVYDEAGRALQDERLYVDETARAELQEQGIAFEDDAEAAAREVLQDAGVPIHVAILPAAAATSGDAQDLATAVGNNGVYLVILSDNLRPSVAHNIGVSTQDLRQVAATARASSGGDLEAFIADFTGRVEDLAAGGTGAPPADEPSGDGSGYLPLAILLAAGGGGLLLYRRNKRQRELTELNQVRGALDEDITAYGEELTSLELDPRDRSVSAEARDEYATALELYETAKSAAARAEAPGHLRPVTGALEQGRWLLACVRARLNGEEIPERRPPCFFDPRHGPSVADVTWTPPGGTPREVPACQADVVRLQEGEEPDSRLVTVDGERRPYWEAGPAYSAWAAGYYGGFLPAMLWGTMLGSAMASGPAYADTGGFDGGAEGGFEGGGFDSGGFDGGGFDGGGFDGGGFDF
ncbi:MAG TPA: hypothetical protein VFY84_13025 [Jiangellales bacterium]|nr:hypothetical protein [Jiangellales bacterium]